MFTTADLLETIPGLPREILYAWCDRGYINPTQYLIGNKKYRRKEFSETSVIKAKLMWKYYSQQGLPPRLANSIAEELITKSCFLELSVDKASSWTQISLNQEFEVLATVEAFQIESCQISVSFDEHLSLKSGQKTQRLRFNRFDTLFYGEVDVAWGFRAKQVRELPSHIYINVHAGEEVRSASIPVVIKG